MKAMARYDFERNAAPRLKNADYLNEYGNCYAIAEASGYYTGV
jgi:hypothetical protein